MKDKIIIKKLDNIDNPYFDTICDWNYEWWGKDEQYSYEQLKEHFKYSLNKWILLPQTFIAISEEKRVVVGMYRINPSDRALVRSDIYPLLSSVYVEKNHRSMWIWTKLMEHAMETIKNLNIKKIYLYTDLDWFYEKFWWKYIWDVNTLDPTSPIDKLYIFETK